MTMNDHGFKRNSFVLLITFLLPLFLNAQNVIEAMQQKKQIVEAGFNKWSKGEGSFFELLADDVRWTITGNGPLSKVYTSRQQFLDGAIEPLNRRLSQKIVPKVRGIYAEGDMVIALWDGVARDLEGKPYNNTYSWYMKMDKGKIVDVVAFFDNIQIADLWRRVPLDQVD
jgi:ketosteroid isomerase-like protein